MPLTVVSFHAHPDDEALLTGGTLAKLCDGGHRVVMVTATDGAAGLTSRDIYTRGALGEIRLRELEQSAAALGVHRVVSLGYIDGAFADVPVRVAASITHRVDVRRQIPAKKAALAAHHSQTVGAQQRTVGVLLGLPAALLGPVVGYEWFSEVGQDRSEDVAEAWGSSRG